MEKQNIRIKLRAYDNKILDQSTLEMGKVLIVGAGALGNEVSKNLAQCSVGAITIIDSDQVELTNLNRCVYFQRSDIGSQKATTLGRRIREYFPDTTVTEICGRFEDVDDAVLKDTDLVVSCVDNMDTRLTINRWCAELKTPLVDGGTDGLYGRVQTIFPPATCIGAIKPVSSPEHLTRLAENCLKMNDLPLTGYCLFGNLKGVSD